ncbi:TIGR04561 family membrane protein [Williamsoniiplasma luminosum]|uniref:Uncharacterized protein n=1 Tax=Williamsoniiplasma luminosum TaxID=214888 RepID=A0A2S0NJN3_9MOLU|nr:TIGR04561 family membrane protein [Williamsoniiplasma luminosum]AVP49219.1 MAG: hypothetical protein C5T88_01320 [Williamsoniiplasma luminosum]
MFLSSLEVFGLNVPLSILVYVFSIMAGLTLLIYILNLVFRKIKQETTNNEELENIKKIELGKQHVDNEIQSILKDRKKGKKWTSLIKRITT